MSQHRLVLAGADGLTLVQTTTGGQTWINHPLNLFEHPIEKMLAKGFYLHFIDPTTGWLVVKNATSSNFSAGSLFKTSDGGVTWKPLNIPIGEPVYFVSDLLGWTAGGASGKELYRTQDGGQTWHRQEVGSQSGQDYYYQLPEFFNQVEGVLAVGTNSKEGSFIHLYTTFDGGQTWTLSQAIPAGGEMAPNVEIPFTAIDNNHWKIAVPHQSQMLGAQGGSEPATLTHDPIITGIRRIDFSANLNGWADYRSGTCSSDTQTAARRCAAETGLFRTEDGGQTWHPIVLPEADPNTGSTITLSHIVNLPAPNGNALTTDQGFDTCEIPTLGQLQSWWNSSPYRSVNLYFGGSLRACANSALNSAYVSQMAGQGWKFIPTWVGPQAPCTGYGIRINYDSTTAYNQGVAEANAAGDALANLGLSNSIAYYDMERFDETNAACRNAVKAFVSGWSGQMRTRGHKAGIYSASAHLIDWVSIGNVPDAVWIANWYWNAGQGYYASWANVWDYHSLPSGYWSDHQRLRQYAGDFNDTWGSTTLNIDANAADGVVATLTNNTVPANVNLVRNGDFSNGTTYWGFPGQGNYNVTSGVLRMERTGGTFVGVEQNVGYRTTAGMPMELTLDLGNSSGADHRFRVHVRNVPANWNEALICEWIVPANTPLKTYTIRGTVANWSDFGIYIEDWNPGQWALIDNIDLRYRTDIQPLGTECSQPAPDNTNLIRNGDFSQGFQYWSSHGYLTYQVVGNVLQMGRNTNPDAGTNGSAVQYTGYVILQNSNLEMTVDLGNATSTARPVTIALRRGDSLAHITCNFTLPPNAPMRQYILRGKTGMLWATLRADIIVSEPRDNVQAILVDNVSVKRRTDITVAGNECIEPASQPPSTVTQTSPSGNITSRTPTFTWQKEANSTSYDLQVVRNDVAVIFTQTYSAAAVCGVSTCSVSPTLDLSSDYYSWWVRGVNGAGNGPWSGQGFAMTILPGLVTQTAPIGAANGRGST